MFRLTVSFARWHPFERAVLDTARRHQLLRADDHVLVALSGGPDSTALLATMLALRAKARIAALTACHVDHGLRPESAADAVFCAELCARLDVPFRAERIAVPGGESVQAAARRERYRALARVAADVGATRIATGHTRSDQAETVLHRLIRGAGARGLAGIPIRRGRIVRPLLERSREEIVAYLSARGLAAREDPSNRSPRFLRNRIRHEVLPRLEALVPGVERRLARTASLLRADDRFLERCAREIVPAGEASVSLAPLREGSVAVATRAIRRLWRAATGTRKGLEGHHVDAVLRLVRRGGPGSLDLPCGVRATVSRQSLELRRRAGALAPS